MESSFDIDRMVSDIMNQDIERAVATYFRENNLTLSFAESCTGGYLSHVITSLAGSSTYFKGGLVAYDNDIKHRILHVPHKILMKDGAVSEACVHSMAKHGRALFQTDYAMAVSGIAGPGGASPEKPVGTVWIGLASEKEIRTRCFYFGNKDRKWIIRKTALEALCLLLDFVKSTINK
ncbi:MAG: CinA family protein [Bacteroidales bacterium]|jgi:nicotinamide-nucleotide amidase|nr:CinA family protein [Bacteroidales bacterium]MDD4045454.1 CinA family protein [Bacteroidales bacterium]NLO41995.1 CinA family protein [Bacteroidales bacterium]